MSHEITKTDGVVFSGTKAWHGLGLVVEDALNPQQALKLAGLDWNVIKTDNVLSSLSDSTYVSSNNFSAIVREDTREILSIQSPDYQVVQNSEVFNLAYSLGENVKIESALSLQGGKKVICLVKGNSFAPSNSTNDEIFQYFALMSSHDGTMALSGLPTSIRIVCSNTLKMALNNAKKGNIIRFTHNGNMDLKKKEMQVMLTNFAKTGKFFEETVNILSNTILTREDIQKFYLRVYEDLFASGPLNLNPVTEQEEKDYFDARVKVGTWCGYFDRERSDLSAPPSAWMAVNAVTKYIQHNVSNKGKKVQWENRAYNNLMGSNQDNSVKVVNMALQLV
jgi:phage/plasmid-like protein (TIGR03299 family)